MSCHNGNLGVALKPNTCSHLINEYVLLNNVFPSRHIVKIFKFLLPKCIQANLVKSWEIKNTLLMVS